MPIQRLKRLFGLDKQYTIGRFNLRLPASHLLPGYQREHKKYDKFLPHLSTYLPPGSTVIDVGANCGDTLAAMLSSNPDLNYVCIEPDDEFFTYLTTNAETMRKIEPRSSILLCKSLIGKAVVDGVLLGTGGTKHVSSDHTAGSTRSAHSSITLDSLVAGEKISNIRALKIDVDGYDYDVVDSAMHLIESQRPVLFFECQFTDAVAKVHYEKTITALSNIGYDEWTVFDNYGEVVLNSATVGSTFQLFDYVLRQNAAEATRTIYYYDIASATPTNRTFLTAALQSYFVADGSSKVARSAYLD